MPSYSNHDKASVNRNTANEMDPKNFHGKHAGHLGSKHSNFHNAKSTNLQGIETRKPDICCNQIGKQNKFKKNIIILCHNKHEEQSKYSEIINITERESTLSIHNQESGVVGHGNNAGAEQLTRHTITRPECGNDAEGQQSSLADIQAINHPNCMTGENRGFVSVPRTSYNNAQIIDHVNRVIGENTDASVTFSPANQQSVVPPFNQPSVYSQPVVETSKQNANCSLNGNELRLENATDHLTRKTQKFCRTFPSKVNKRNVKSGANTVTQTVTNVGNGCFLVSTTTEGGNGESNYQSDNFIIWADGGYIFMPSGASHKLSSKAKEINGDFFRSIKKNNDGNTNYNLISNEQGKEKMEKPTDDFRIQRPCSSFSSLNNNIHRKVLRPQFVDSSQPAPNSLNSTPKQSKEVVTEEEMDTSKPLYSWRRKDEVLKEHSYSASAERCPRYNYSANVVKISAENKECEILYNSADTGTKNVSADRSPKDETDNSESKIFSRSIKDKPCDTTPLLQNIPNCMLGVENISATKQTTQSFSSRYASVNDKNIVEARQKCKSTSSLPDTSLSETKKYIQSLKVKNLLKKISKEVTVKLSEKIRDISGTYLLQSDPYGNKDIQASQFPSQEILEEIAIKPKQTPPKKQVAIASLEVSSEEYKSKATSVPTSVVNIGCGSITSCVQKGKAAPTQEIYQNYGKQAHPPPKLIKGNDGCILLPQKNVVISKVQAHEKEFGNSATTNPKSVAVEGNFGNNSSDILTSQNSKEILNLKDFGQDDELCNEPKLIDIMDNDTGTHCRRPLLIYHRRKVKRKKKDYYECGEATLKANCLQNNNNNCNTNPKSSDSCDVKGSMVSAVPEELNHEYSSGMNQRPKSVEVTVGDDNDASDSHLLYPENSNVSLSKLVTNISKDVPSHNIFIKDNTSYNDCDFCSPLESQCNKLSVTSHNQETFEETTFKQNLAKAYSRKSKVSSKRKRQNRRGKLFSGKLAKHVNIVTGTVAKSGRESSKDIKSLSVYSRKGAKSPVETFPKICSGKVVEEIDKCSPGQHVEKEVNRKGSQPQDPVTESKSPGSSIVDCMRKIQTSNLSLAKSALASTNTKKSDAVNELQFNRQSISSYYSNLDSLLINNNIDSLSINDSTALFNENNHYSTNHCNDDDTQSELNKEKEDDEQHSVSKMLEVMRLSVVDGNCFCKNKMQISARDQNDSCAICCAKQMSCETPVSTSDPERILYPFDRNMLFTSIGLVGKELFNIKQSIPPIIAHRTRNVQAIKIKEKEREYNKVNQHEIPYSYYIEVEKGSKSSLLNEPCFDDAEVNESPKDSPLKILSFEKSENYTDSISDVDKTSGKKLHKEVCESSFKGNKDGSRQEKENSPNITTFNGKKGNENAALVSNSRDESDSVLCRDNAEKCNESSRCKDAKDNLKNYSNVHEPQNVPEKQNRDAGESVKCLKRKRSVFGKCYNQCKIDLSPSKQMDGNTTPFLHSECQKSSKDTDQQNDLNTTDCLQPEASVLYSIPEYVASVPGQNSSRHAQYKNFITVKKRCINKALHKKFKYNNTDERAPANTNIDKALQITKSNNTLHDNNAFPEFLRSDKLDSHDSQSSFEVKSCESIKNICNNLDIESMQHENIVCDSRTIKENKNNIVQPDLAQSDISSMENNGLDQLQYISSVKNIKQNLVQSVNSKSVYRQNPLPSVGGNATCVDNLQDPKLAKSSMSDKVNGQNLAQSSVSFKYKTMGQAILQTSLSAGENGCDVIPVLCNTSKEIGQGLIMFVKSVKYNGKTPLLCGSLADENEESSVHVICNKIKEQDLVQPNLPIEDDNQDSFVCAPLTECNGKDSLQYVTLTKTIEHDLVQSNDSAESKRHTFVESKRHTSIESKRETSIESKRHGSVKSKAHTNVESKRNTNVQNKAHTNVESKRHTNVESKRHTNEESQRHTNVGSKRQTNVESKTHTSAENKRHGIKKNKGQASTKSKGHISAKRKRQASAKGKGWTSAESEELACAECMRLFFAESKGQAFTESKGQAFTESKGQAFTESKGQAFTKSKGQVFTKSKGQPFTKSKGQPFTKSKGQAFTKSKGQAFTKSKGQAFTKSKGQAFTDSKRQASAESKGQTSAESKGQASVESKGQTSAESKGQTSAESKGQTSAESKGQTSAESKGQTSAESKGQTSAESKRQTSAESKGQTSAESKGQASAESKGQASVESKGQTSAESKGQTSAESKGQASAESKGQASAESKGQASAESKGQASAESKGQASAESKGQTSAESKGQGSADSREQASVESMGQASTLAIDDSEVSAQFITSYKSDFIDSSEKTSRRGNVKFFYRSSGLRFTSSKEKGEKNMSQIGKCQYVQIDKLENNDFLGFDDTNMHHKLCDNSMPCKSSNDEIYMFSNIPDESNMHSLNLDELDILDTDVIDPASQCSVSFMEGRTHSKSNLCSLLPSVEISSFCGGDATSGSTEELLSTDLPSPEMRNITGRAMESFRQETPEKILRANIKKSDAHVKMSCEIQISDNVVDQINAAQKESGPDKTAATQKVQRDIFRTTELKSYLPLASRKRRGKKLNKRFKYNVIMKNGKRLYPCDLCGHKSGSSGDLVRHMRTHNGERPFKCDICLRAYKQKDGLNKHMLVHEGKRPYVCTTCNKAFSQKAHLKSHQKVHTGEKPFRCEECGKSFSRLDHLKGHEHTHMLERPFKCDLCTLTFKCCANLAKHKQIHLDVRRHQCTYCDASFLVAHSLKLHVRTHTGEKPVHCPLCNVDFRFESSLRKHASTFHPDFEVRGSILVPVPLD
ncbi:uncharacterized protein [Procambarus clarkii]|uniref:uncharacterized protein n=1 Tax=Procambarus clarkii TaxID=6728 RepID=UPI003744A0B6